jgi:hypothetical protein
MTPDKLNDAYPALPPILHFVAPYERAIRTLNVWRDEYPVGRKGWEKDFVVRRDSLLWKLVALNKPAGIV